MAGREGVTRLATSQRNRNREATLSMASARIPFLILLVSAAVVHAQDWSCPPGSPSPIKLPSVSIGQNFPPAGAQGYEASGVVWHPRLNRLFTVHDGNSSLGGSVTVLNLDGSNVTNWVLGRDLEGVTVANPNSNFVYLAQEQPNDSVVEFNFVTGAVTKVWDLTNLANCTSGCEADGVPFPDPPGNAGIEAITFVPDPGPSGGVFYLGIQSTGYVSKVRIDLSSSTGKYQYLGHAARLGPWNGPGGVGVQGLHYDRVNDVLWVLVGQERALALRPNGAILGQWILPEPSGTHEGISFANSSCEFLVAWDDFEGGPANRLRKYRFQGCTQDCREREIPATRTSGVLSIGLLLLLSGWTVWHIRRAS